jgi:hypothetical protein
MCFEFIGIWHGGCIKAYRKTGPQAVFYAHLARHWPGVCGFSAHQQLQLFVGVGAALAGKQ